MAKEGITGNSNIIQHYKDICKIVDGDVSAEVISVDFEGMKREGEMLAKLNPQIVVKVPMIEEGVKALKYFSDVGIKTNCTLVFSSGQALIAAKAGANYVSPFIGRLDDNSTDGLELIKEIRQIYDNFAFKTEILAASIRHTMHIVNCAKIGADVITGPLSSIKGLLNHPLTDIGLKKVFRGLQKRKLETFKTFSNSISKKFPNPSTINPFLFNAILLFKSVSTQTLLALSKSINAN